jgi:hypothetical protein
VVRICVYKGAWSSGFVEFTLGRRVGRARRGFIQLGSEREILDGRAAAAVDARLLLELVLGLDAGIGERAFNTEEESARREVGQREARRRRRGDGRRRDCEPAWWSGSKPIRGLDRATSARAPGQAKEMGRGAPLATR